MRQEKRFPTIIGIILLLAAVVGGVYLTNKGSSFLTKASGDCEPINPQVTNLTATSAVFSFTTSGECLSSLSIDNRIIEDIRTEISTNLLLPSKIHYFQVDNLIPSTEYLYSFISGGKKISRPEYKTTTPSKPSKVAAPSSLAWGKVLTPDQKPASNVIVYLNIPGAMPLSSYVTSNGNWNISLANSLNDSKTDWFTLPENPVEESIIVIADNGQTTQLENTTARNNPVPDIILGQNTFSESSGAVNSEYLPDETGQLANISPVVNNKNLDIQNPTENETVKTQLPNFFGTGPSGAKILIRVEGGQRVDSSVTADLAGNWQWSPTTKLAVGSNQITAGLQNPVTGKFESVSRNFFIEGINTSELQFVASASATIRPSPTVQPTSTRTPSPSKTPPTPTPTIKPTSTKIPTPTPTIRTVKITTTIPQSGNTTPTSIAIIAGLLFLAISIIWYVY